MTYFLNLSFPDYTPSDSGNIFQHETERARVGYVEVSQPKKRKEKKKEKQ